MRRRFAALAAMSAFALALSASPAMAGRVSVISIPYDYTDPSTGEPAFPPIACLHHTYTFTSGTFQYVSRDTSVAAHVTIKGAWAVDEGGASYRVVGAESYSDPGGRFTAKIMFVAREGRIADSVNALFRASPNGGFFLDFGTCTL